MICSAGTLQNTPFPDLQPLADDPEIRCVPITLVGVAKPAECLQVLDKILSTVRAGMM